jgi:hypothetical protein
MSKNESLRLAGRPRAATAKTLRLKASLVNVGQRISAIEGRFEH